MSNLIDRQALLDEIWKMRMNYQMMDDTHTADKIMHGLYRAEQAVKEVPTIDAVPVRHGEWEQVEVIDYDGISMNDDAVRCNVCGHVEQSVYWARTYYHYCPNCGARMDGGKDDRS